MQTSALRARDDETCLRCPVKFKYSLLNRPFIEDQRFE